MEPFRFSLQEESCTVTVNNLQYHTLAREVFMTNETSRTLLNSGVVTRLVVVIAVLIFLFVVIDLITRSIGLENWIIGEQTPENAGDDITDSENVTTILAAIVAVLSALFLVIDFITRSIGLVDWIIGRPTPLVLVDVVNKDSVGHGQCVKFAFSSLPANFILEEIHLDIIDFSKGDAKQALSLAVSVIHETRVETQVTIPDVEFASPTLDSHFTSEVSLPYLPEQKPKIVVRYPVQADKAEDVFFIHWCPILTGRWTHASLTVVPTFFDATGELIRGLDVRTTSGVAIDDGVKVALTNEKAILES